ncbi:hypothetical protein GCM10008932_17660 [Alkalibacterium iburiense]|uniref:Uncharacterized protein n=1 Tax=Alkalibacterium iburiense TaxID=290589 RepID=A0ABN0XJW8_9LACT
MTIPITMNKRPIKVTIRRFIFSLLTKYILKTLNLHTSSVIEKNKITTCVTEATTYNLSFIIQ